MKTTELFKFRFVDRQEEQKRLDAFLSQYNDNALWIRGNSGFGKTKFFHYVLDKHKEYHLCYIDIKKDQSDVEILSNLIVELQKFYDVDFLENTYKNYKKFYNSTYKQAKNITSELFPKISSIISVILDAGYYVVTHTEENKNSMELIADYIKLIISNKKLCICIDNFSLCNIELAQHFFQIIKQFIAQDNFRACIVTTSEDLQTKLKEEIYYHLPHISIEISEFDKFSYFYQILEPIFEMGNFTKEDLNYIYQKCGGSPKKLSTVISKLLEKNGIQLVKQKKAKIDKAKLLDILRNDHVKFEDNDFSSIQKWIIFSYLCLGEQIDIHQLKELALYISSRCWLYSAYNEDKFNSELLTLINNRILNYDLKGVISTYHNLDYVELMDIFKNSQLKEMFSQYAYEFLLTHRDYPGSEGLICRHAREINVYNWEKLNFYYGKKLFYQNQIYDSQSVLSNLGSHIHKLHAMQMMFVALVAYKTGNYQTSISAFKLLQLEHLKFTKVKYYYFFYLGKSYYNIGNLMEAVNMLEKSLEFIPLDSEQYVQTLNVLHMFYYEIPEKISESEYVFNKIKNSYKKTHPIAWANTMRGCQNFLDNTTSLKILQNAGDILEDEVERAYIKNTQGFVYIKQNCLLEAEKQFYDAAETIKRLRIHEFSYAANNLAICYMLKKNYKQAKDILLEALLWNRTNYGSLVLQVHLMMCTLHLNSEDEANYYFGFLSDYMENHNVIDPIVKRKVYMNLAIFCKKRHQHIMKKSYLEKAKPFTIGSSSEWRYNVLADTVVQKSNKPPLQYMQIIDFDPWFLIYAHD